MNENLFMYSLGIALASMREKELSEIEQQGLTDLEYAHKLGYTASMHALLSWLVPVEDVENEFDSEEDKAYALFIHSVWQMLGGREE